MIIFKECRSSLWVSSSPLKRMTGSRCSIKTVPSRYFRFFEQMVSENSRFDSLLIILNRLGRYITNQCVYIYTHITDQSLILLKVLLKELRCGWRVLRCFSSNFSFQFFRFQMFYFMGETVLDSSCSFVTSKITSWTKTNFWKRSHEIEILLTKNTSTSLARKLIH